MNRITKYKESIIKFIKTKGNPNGNLTSESLDIVTDNNQIPSIILLTILNGQVKKKKMKSYHAYYMAFGISLMYSMAVVYDNLNFYEKKHNKNDIQNFLLQIPTLTSESLSQNIQTLSSNVDKTTILKIYHRISSYISKKMLDLSKYEKLNGNEYVKKTDIIKYHFDNKDIIDTKYKKLKKIDKDILIGYVERKYGSVCQCAFVAGWLLGLGDEKMVNNLERLGIYFSIILKLARDFENLEKDINNSENVSYNLIINYGIYECFSMFDNNKIKFIEGCLTLDIFSPTIKEIIDFVEKCFDEHLQKTDLELKSIYSSFSTRS